MDHFNWCGETIARNTLVEITYSDSKGKEMEGFFFLEAIGIPKALLPNSKNADTNEAPKIEDEQLGEVKLYGK